MQSHNEEIALSYSHLDQTSTYYQVYIEMILKLNSSELNDISNIPEEHLSNLKMKLGNICQKYIRIKVLLKCKQTAKELSKNENIIIMQLDKGPGVIIMDKHRYHEKYLLLLHTCNFKKLDYDPTKTTEEKIQRILQKMKKNKNETRICMFISKWILSQQVLWNCESTQIISK